VLTVEVTSGRTEVRQERQLIQKKICQENHIPTHSITKILLFLF